MRFENTVTIRRPTSEVFAFLADFENVLAWNYAILETKKNMLEDRCDINDLVAPRPPP
jgi:hypothetical protein